MEHEKAFKFVRGTLWPLTPAPVLSHTGAPVQCAGDRFHNNGAQFAVGLINRRGGHPRTSGTCPGTPFETTAALLAGRTYSPARWHIDEAAGRVRRWNLMGVGVTGRFHMASPMQSESRLEFAKAEIDRVFGANYSTNHPQLLAAVLICVTIDQAAAAS